MKTTLTRFTAFLLLFTFVSAAGVLLQSGYLHLNPYPIDDEVRTVITGNSIPKLSLDPEEISHSISVAQSAESVQVSYYKLKYLLGLHNSIQSIVLGISPESFVAHGLPLSTEDSFPAGHANIGIYNVIKLKDVLQDEDLTIDTFIKGYLKTALYNPNFYRALITAGKYYPFIGGFQPSEGRRPNHDINYPIVFENIYSASDNQPNPVLPEARRYLQKIIALCEKKSVSLNLVYIPAHPEHHQKIPDIFKIYYAEVVEELKSNKAVHYYDFGHDNLPDEHFYDHFHLNTEGARVFSRRLNKLLPEPAVAVQAK